MTMTNPMATNLKTADHHRGEVGPGEGEPGKTSPG